MQMPEPDAKVLARRDDLITTLRQIVPGEGVIADDAGMRVFCGPVRRRRGNKAAR